MLKCHGANGLGLKLQARTVGYDEAKAYSAKRLDLERTCAAHPREALLDPSLVLKTNAQENERSQDPMFWASVADWENLAVVLVDQNTRELIEFDEVAESNGRKVLSGLTGVAKAGNDRHTVPQRLIMHIKLSNWDQNVVMGGMLQLPTSGRWSCSVLESGVTLVWFGEGLKRCFCVVEVPKPWRTCVAFTALEARGLFFPGSMGQDHLCSKAVPMGWISALESFTTFTVSC